MAQPEFEPESRSIVQPKVDRIGRLLLGLFLDAQVSRADAAARLREIARLAMSAAHDLNPRDG